MAYELIERSIYMNINNVKKVIDEYITNQQQKIKSGKLHNHRNAAEMLHKPHTQANRVLNMRSVNQSLRITPELHRSTLHKPRD